MQIPIQCFTNLSELMFVPSWHGVSTWSWVSSLLRQIQSKVRHIRLKDVMYHGPDGDEKHPHAEPCFCLLPGPGTTELDEALAGDIYESLVEVELTLMRTCLHEHWPSLPKQPHRPLDHDEVLAQMRESLPKLSARGIIALGEERW